MEVEGLPGRQVTYEPTFRIEPVEEEQFMPNEVKGVAEKVLQEQLKATESWPAYNEDSSYTLCLDITNSIKDEVKQLNIPRYKVVVQVTLGERKDQGLRATSRCLWDITTDNYATATYKNEKIWCVAMIFGCYTF